MQKSVRQAQSIVGTSPGRPKHDFYPTPKHVTQSLLDREQFNGMIWECACGDGAMSGVLIENGYDVYSTDLIDRGYSLQSEAVDFLTASSLSYKRIPNIVTNPPFKLAEKFVDRAINYWHVDKLALFCKLAFLEGQKRATLLETTPLKNIYVFKKRVLLTRNGEKPRSSGMIAFAWYVWEFGYVGKPMVNWI